MQSVRFTARLNPAADLPGRLENLRRMAAPGSGASDNERQTALRLIAKIEAELKASGWRPPPPAPPPSRTSSYSYSPPWEETERKPIKDVFLPIPPAYMPLVQQDLLSRDKGGKNFWFGDEALYEFVKATWIWTPGWRRNPWGENWGKTINGFLLLAKPGPRAEREMMPIISGFYGDVGYGPISLGQWQERLVLKATGLHGEGDDKLLFQIAANDAQALIRMNAFYTLAH